MLPLISAHHRTAQSWHSASACSGDIVGQGARHKAGGRHPGAGEHLAGDVGDAPLVGVIEPGADLGVRFEISRRWRSSRWQAPALERGQWRGASWVATPTRICPVINQRGSRWHGAWSATIPKSLA